MTDRTDTIILGQKIGTHADWYEFDSFVVEVRDFEPAPTIPLPATGILIINFASGLISFEATGGEIVKVPIFETLGYVPLEDVTFLSSRNRTL